MNVNQATIDLIKKYEGFSSREYICPGGFKTIGYGHKIKPGEHFTNILPTQGENLLKYDLQVHAKDVEALIKVPVNDNQFGAIVSFSFNLGAQRLKESSLLDELNDGAYTEAAHCFMKFVFADKKKLDGLIKRRAEEILLFLTK